MAIDYELDGIGDLAYIYIYGARFNTALLCHGEQLF